MSKVLLKVSIESNNEMHEYTTRGILNEKLNILIYNGNDIKNRFDFSKNILERENNEIKIFLPFEINKENNAVYYDKQNKIKLNIKLYTNVLRINRHNVYIEYTLDNTNLFTYKLHLIKIIKK